MGWKRASSPQISPKKACVPGAARALHRVDEINRIRQQLTQNGVDASLVRITEVAAKN